MGEPKPFASLSSGLLARKGAAKPAMRPQGFGQLGAGVEDLGWNDMGYGHAVAPAYQAHDIGPAEHVPSSIAALTPAPRPQGDKPVAEETAPEPPVVEQQRAIEATFSGQVGRAAPESEAAPSAPRPRRAPGSKGKAAFTLRLDPERHLKLRLACAVAHRSAQQVVTDALDSYLNSLPELDAFAGRLPAKTSK